jgi:hypothetical protein
MFRANGEPWGAEIPSHSSEVSSQSLYGSKKRKVVWNSHISVFRRYVLSLNDPRKKSMFSIRDIPEMGTTLTFINAH